MPFSFESVKVSIIELVGYQRKSPGETGGNIYMDGLVSTGK
jgi:hypothetical protein